MPFVAVLPVRLASTFHPKNPVSNASKACMFACCTPELLRCTRVRSRQRSAACRIAPLPHLFLFPFFHSNPTTFPWSSLCTSEYGRLPKKGKPNAASEWTVLAAVVKEDNRSALTHGQCKILAGPTLEPLMPPTLLLCTHSASLCDAIACGVLNGTLTCSL